MRIAVVSNTSWYLYNFRIGLMRALRDAKFDVVAVGPQDDYVAKIEREAGISHCAFPVKGDGTNPVLESLTIFGLARTFRREKIDLVLSNTPKGNIYSALAARMVGVPVIPNVSGLGRVYIKRSSLTQVVRLLYRLALSRAPRVFFQNWDDHQYFIDDGFVQAERAVVIPGSGVDLDKFKPLPPQARADGRFTFLLVARLLWDKGVGEYVEAARAIRRDHPEVRFQLLGPMAVANPAAITEPTVAQWQAEGVVEYLGTSDEVSAHLHAADCVVLPSYREGTPRSMLEAAACGKPVITSDAVGCRNTVNDGVTGFLCKVRNAHDLEDKMRRMIALSPAQRGAMGAMGRRKMEREYDQNIVIERYLEAVYQVLGAPARAKAREQVGHGEVPLPPSRAAAARKTAARVEGTTP